MSDRRARSFLEAILANPDDDAPRLVYSDGPIPSSTAAQGMRPTRAMGRGGERAWARRGSNSGVSLACGAGFGCGNYLA
jgi:hypothetical protein